MKNNFFKIYLNIYTFKTLFFVLLKMSYIGNIINLIYNINPKDNLRFNTYFIKCFREGKIIKDEDYNYFKKYYGLYWANAFEQLDFHNLKIKVSYCCASIGDTVNPYTLFIMGDTIYIFYSSIPLNGYIFYPIDENNFWFGQLNQKPVFIHCFNAIPNIVGIVSYNRNNKPTLYLDYRDFMPICN